MTINKPSSLVVIGGWLGCQPKHLKRYEALYNSLGFDALSFVASPLSVVDSTLRRQRSPENKIQIPSPTQWPTSDTHIYSASTKLDTNMQDLAWKVLGDVYNSRAEIFIYHSFSNGGCFLWETLCRILLFKNHKDCNCKTAAVLEELSIKCKGIVFDSCPAWFGSKGPSSKLWQALQHCSEEEKQHVISMNGARIHTVDDELLNRNLEYFHNLAACPLDIPQLYLYSENDELSKHEYIAKMIDTRRSRQKRPVLQQVWEHSIHCNHLREHCEDYTKTVKAFIQQLDISCEARL